jgi:hypothetical protein
MMRMDRTLTVACAALALLAGGCADRAGKPVAEAGAPEAPRPPPNPLRNAYFGDLHLHTSFSFDAVASGTTATPMDSYRFAAGGAVDYLGKTIQRRVPLDFLAVTDHAEYLGVVREAADPKGRFSVTEWPKLFAQTDPAALTALFRRLASSGFQGGPRIREFLDDEMIRGNWQREIEAAERNYRPGFFTTFAAFEWSAMPGGAHLHRNVIFKGPRYPQRPFSAIDSMRPEDLWSFAETQRRDGVETLLIPHNSNLSDGLMFALRDSDNNPITRAYAERRAANEGLLEITQNKGTSETRPELSPTDEFAGFELMGARVAPGAQIEGGYVRSALKRGLETQAKVGANPFDYGFVGASDFHSGFSASEEFNFPGGLGRSDSQDNPKALLTETSPITGQPLTVLSAGGLTGVWAEENTREAIFDALRRREVFATSGSRLRVRMFASFDYPGGLVRRQDWLAAAYRTGVPMGADLTAPAAGRSAPRFLLQALKDPDSGNLDRIQVVKLWYAGGQSHERVYDAVWSGARRADPKTGKLPPVGNTFDPKTGRAPNTIGAVQLVGEWTDPDFDPKAPAIYYARVLEIPTARWTSVLAIRNGLPLPPSVPPTLQERAWTSPIFYQAAR